MMIELEKSSMVVAREFGHHLGWLLGLVVILENTHAY